MDSNKIFNIHKYLRVCLQEGTAGTTNQASLPNITGNASFCGRAGSAGPGCLKKSVYSNAAPAGANLYGISNLIFDASDSNTIYGLSDTVMPNSINFLVVIYLGK